MKKNIRLILLGIFTLCMGLYVTAKIFPDFGASLTLALLGGSTPAMIKSGDSYLCQIALDRIKKMSPPEKKSFSSFFEGELAGGPVKVSSVRPLNGLALALLGDQIPRRNPVDVCFFMALTEVAPTTPELLPLLLRPDNFIGYQYQLAVGPIMVLIKDNPDGAAQVAKLLDNSNPTIKTQAQFLLTKAGDAGLKFVIANLFGKKLDTRDSDFQFLMQVIRGTKTPLASLELKDFLVDPKLDDGVRGLIFSYLVTTYGKDKFPQDLAAFYDKKYPDARFNNTVNYQSKITNETLAKDSDQMLHDIDGIGALYIIDNWNHFGDIATKANQLNSRVESENKIYKGSKLDLHPLGKVFEKLLQRLEQSKAPIEGMYSNIVLNSLNTDLVNTVGPFLLALPQDPRRDKAVLSHLLISPATDEPLLKKGLARFKTLSEDDREALISNYPSRGQNVSYIVLEAFLDTAYGANENIYGQFVNSYVRSNEPYIIYLNQKSSDQKNALKYLSTLALLNQNETYRKNLRVLLTQKWVCSNGPYNSLIALNPWGNKKSDDKENALFSKLLSCPVTFLKDKESWQYAAPLKKDFKNMLENAAKTEKDSEKKKLFTEVLKKREDFNPEPMPMPDDMTYRPSVKTFGAKGEGVLKPLGLQTSYGPPPPAPKN